ncbi:uncharacterized protein N7479_003724 [Penicillium vulpinum]|uniref:uncharacterized protein n=1 Tax=Penicillium vulpinum TaxID=29845 RepID=UPI0025482413|nr:uncharacterized protein N7479_003724 [Penicillium vulpinum]KAJ5963848.1 hypothetical protein N7479_003724 [Penicillium vulpinum]
MDMIIPAVFSISTQITILFTGWTTSTTTQSVFALAFVFFLAIFDRFLGAVKFQLEKSWSQDLSNLRPLLPAPLIRRRSIRKANTSPLPGSARVPGGEDPGETLPASNKEYSRSALMRRLEMGGSRNKTSLRHLLPSWKASGSWCLRKDGTRALLECIRALIGYLLCVVISAGVRVLSCVE